MTDRECCIACNCISGIGYSTFSALVKVFGSPANIPGHSKQEYLAARGVGEKMASALENTDFELACAKELNRAAASDVKIVTICDVEYPQILKDLSSPPIALYVAGKLPQNYDFSLGIVGSRNITKYAQEQTSKIAFDAAYNKFTIISGMAEGADCCAHRAALDAGGITIGVIGAGLENIYPAVHRNLAKEIIASGGALISELPMQFPVTATGFPRRNRIIAGLSRGVLVTEAGLKSGSMITADYAKKSNRMLFAIPGRTDNANVSGCHKLIKEGAFLTENFRDIAEKYNLANVADSPATVKPPLPEMKPNEKTVYDAIKKGINTPDKLVIATKLHISSINVSLMMLELQKVITRDPDSTYRILI